MKHSKNIISRIFSPDTAIWIIPLLLIVPNAALCVTESMPLPAACANILLPFGAYLLVMSLSAKCGRSALLLLPIMFLAAFQIVLLFLYHGSIIAVDMFLNVVTTNSAEVSELLDNLIGSMLTVGILYLPPIIWSIISVVKRRRTSPRGMRRGRIAGIITSAAGLAAVATAYCMSPGYRITNDLFPVNVIKNMLTAVDRSVKIHQYPETSAAFKYHAASDHQATGREIYVMVIGETARAHNFGILGYNRDTTPRLNATRGVNVFSKVLSESNTTHKSVPMLMSPIASACFDSLYRSKSVITAFKEAGYATAYISNQHRNGSFIDFFGNEADSCDFIPERTGHNPTDSELISSALHMLDNNNADRLLLVLHTYGSHFCYTDRYSDTDRHFTPDDFTDADAANRQKLLNAYDNTIRHTDANIADLIDRLESMTDARCALVYTSDHGEDIYDDSRQRFLHASPTPTYWQLHVPMIIWTSDSYNDAYPDKTRALQANRDSDISSSASFTPTLLDLAGITYPGFDASKSVASQSYAPSRRIYINDRNEAVRLTDSGITRNDIHQLQSLGISHL